MPGVARLGDSISHGGRIISASGDTFADGLAVARIGDSVMCDKHGLTHIVNGAEGTTTNKLQTARVGDSTACGATIVEGSSTRVIGDMKGGAGTGPIIKFTFQDGTVGTADERDMGAWDDEEDTDNPGVVVYPRIVGRPATKKEIERSKELGHDPDALDPPKEKEVQEAKPTEALPFTCDLVGSTVDYSMALSGNFTLASVSLQAAVSKAKVVAQRGLSEQQIICNLQAVCVNLLEPIAAKYGRAGMNVTSGFRPQKNGRSQHEIGQAIDLQFSGQYTGALSKDAWWGIVMWIKDNVAFDQMIVEYIGNKPWIHLSFNPSGNRKDLKTCIKNGSFKPGLILY